MVLRNPEKKVVLVGELGGKWSRYRERNETPCGGVIETVLAVRMTVLEAERRGRKEGPIRVEITGQIEGIVSDVALESGPKMRVERTLLRVAETLPWTGVRWAGESADGRVGMSARRVPNEGGITRRLLAERGTLERE